MPLNTADLLILQTLRDDPAYDGMDDPTFLAAVNSPTVSAPVASVTKEAVWEAIDITELPAPGTQESDVLGWILGLDVIDIQGNARTGLLQVFGVGTNSRSNLSDLQNELISPAQSVGLRQVHIGDVARTT